MQKYTIEINTEDPAIKLQGQLDLTPNQIDGINRALSRFLKQGQFFVVPEPNINNLNPFIGSDYYDDEFIREGPIDFRRRNDPVPEDFMDFLIRIGGGFETPNKRYYLFFKPQGPRFFIYGFNNPEFLQGFLSVCQWLQQDCKQFTKVYDQNGNSMAF